MVNRKQWKCSIVTRCVQYRIVVHMCYTNIIEIFIYLSDEAGVAVLLLHLHKHPGFAPFKCSCAHIQITVKEVSYRACARGGNRGLKMCRECVSLENENKTFCLYVGENTVFVH